MKRVNPYNPSNPFTHRLTWFSQFTVDANRFDSRLDPWKPYLSFEETLQTSYRGSFVQTSWVSSVSEYDACRPCAINPKQGNIKAVYKTLVIVKIKVSNGMFFYAWKMILVANFNSKAVENLTWKLKLKLTSATLRRITLLELFLMGHSSGISFINMLQPLMQYSTVWDSTGTF